MERKHKEQFEKSTRDIAGLLKWGEIKLRQSHIEESALDSEVLLAHLLRIKRLDLYLNQEKRLTSSTRRMYSKMIEKRMKHVPVAYIIGKKEFMGLDFKVTSETLIPRPETELLVEKVIERIESIIPENSPLKFSRSEILRRIIDLGVGCGNISISIAKRVANCRVYATDIKSSILDVVRYNAIFHGIRDRLVLLKGNLFEPFWDMDLWGGVDFVVSNPPYVMTHRLAKLSEEVKKEPRVALDGGPDGLKFYRSIIPQSRIFLRSGGYLVLEIDEAIKFQVLNLIERESVFMSPELINDYAGLARVCLARKR